MPIVIIKLAFSYLLLLYRHGNPSGARFFKMFIYLHIEEFVKVLPLIRALVFVYIRAYK